MADETIRYRIEVDEASLSSELARARGAITNVLQQAVQVGQYSVNAVQSDLALTRQVLGTPGAPIVASPAQDLGFLGSAFAAAGLRAPPNTLASDYRAAGGEELSERVRDAAIGIGRQALPVGAGLAGIFTGLATHASPMATLAMGGAAFLGGQVASEMVMGDIDVRTRTEELLQTMRAPHPMRPFSEAQRKELAGGLISDVASDVRFGVGELNQMLAMGQGADLFEGVRGVEDFRTRFRSMMESVRQITRVFQQTTQEAIQTLGTLTTATGSLPEAGARVGDILALSRASGIAPSQALGVGLAGAEFARGRGIPMATGFDVMVRNYMAAEAAEATGAVPTWAAQQMGGAGGIAELSLRFNAAAASQVRNLLPAFTNDAMTQIDQGRVRAFISGGLAMEDVQMVAMNRMADPAQRVRFSANVDLLENQMATTGLAAPALMRLAEVRAGITGARPEDMFALMTQQMGLNPIERQVAFAMTRNQGAFNAIADRAQEKAAMDLEMERRREESRFTSRISAGIEEVQTTLSSTIGRPFRWAAEAIGGAVETLTNAPSRFLNWLDVSAGRAIFGGPAIEARPGLATAALPLRAAAERDRGGRTIARQLRDLRGVTMLTEEEAQQNYQDAIQSVFMWTDLGPLKVTSDMSGEEAADFQKEALTVFATDLHDLVSEEDPKRRGEMREVLRGRMEDWIRTNLPNLSTKDQDAAREFSSKMLGVETLAQDNETVKRGLADAAKAGAALQTRGYVTAELPALLGAAAAGEVERGRLMGVMSDVGKAFRGQPALASFHALKTLGEKAIPLLARGSEIRERLDVARRFISADYLRPGDMEIDTRELATVREQNLTATQASFVDDLLKAARDTEGHTLTADVLFRAVGIGLGGGPPMSRTPSPGAGLDGTKWDGTAQALDRLVGSVNNLSSASSQLLQAAENMNKRTAGKA